MKSNTINLAGKNYAIFSFTPRKAKKVITLLRGLNVEELKDIPQGTQAMTKAISVAISSNPIRSFFIRKRIRKATLEELLAATTVVIDMIPIQEFYTVSSITSQFNKTIVK